MNVQHRFFLVLAWLTFSSVGLAQQMPTKEQLSTEILIAALENSHFSPIGVNDTLSKRAFRLYLQSLDYSKNFFLQRDIDELRAYEYRIDDIVNDRNNPLLPLAEKIYQKRMGQTQQYCEEILSRPFDFDVEETIELDPKKRNYLKTETEQRDWWRKLLKYQTMQRVVTALEQQEKDTSMAAAGKKTFAQLEIEAREKVLKAQRERSKRALKETATERLALFLNAIAGSYDPHTDYYPPKDKENFDIEMSGTLEGIGATLQEQDGYIKVQSLVPGGPAWKQKELQPEDLILKVRQGAGNGTTAAQTGAQGNDDDEAVDVTDMRLDDAVRLIRGKKGTQVTLTVKKSSGLIQDVTIVRDVVIIEETFAKSVVLDDVESKKSFGYINLPKFYADFNRSGGRSCADDVKNELEKLKQENVEGIVLDLRNNGGGSLQDVVRMSGLFINDGPIVQVLSSDRPPEVLRDLDRKIVYDGPLVILVNEFSASASEILAAAMQDYGRALIMGGEHSFGKGTVQTFMDLDNYVAPQLKSVGSLGSLKITFQKFYRITGYSTQFKGVRPDIIAPSIYSMVEVGENQLDNSMPWDTIQPQQFMKWKLPYSLDKVAENSKKRIQENPKFQLIQQQSILLKKNRDESLEQSSINAYRKEQERLRKENKQFDELKAEEKNIATRPTKADQVDFEEKKEKNEDWHKQIRRDVYISEAVAVLRDMSDTLKKQ